MDHADYRIHSRIHVQKKKTVKRGIAFFDFDGTITSKDSLLEFIRYARGPYRFYLGMLVLSPYLVLFKLGFFNNQAAKEKVLGFFFRNTPMDAFNQLCSRFALELLPHLIRPAALDEINRLKRLGYAIVVVSASPENWVALWAASHQLEVIASRLETSHGCITGKLTGKNCYGEEKVRRIKEKYAIADYEDIFAYGDSRGDHQMLKLAHTAHYQPFRS